MSDFVSYLYCIYLKLIAVLFNLLSALCSAATTTTDTIKKNQPIHHCLMWMVSFPSSPYSYRVFFQISGLPIYRECVCVCVRFNRQNLRHNSCNNAKDMAIAGYTHIILHCHRVHATKDTTIRCVYACQSWLCSEKVNRSCSSENRLKSIWFCVDFSARCSIFILHPRSYTTHNSAFVHFRSISQKIHENVMRNCCDLPNTLQYSISFVSKPLLANLDVDHFPPSANKIRCHPSGIKL